MPLISPAIRRKFAAKMRPSVVSHQAIYCRFADRIPAADESFAGHDLITEGFLKPIRPAIESIRGFLRFPEERRNRTFEKCFSEQDGKWFFDHLRDEAYDSRFVCRGLSDTGLRLVYSFDSSTVDLAALFGSLWDIQALDNPETAIGKPAVAYAKRIPEGSATLRFAFSLWAYDDPHVLIYASRDRILDLFSLALKHSNVSRHFGRNLKAGFGSRRAA